jgi:hypothetical protein
MYTISRNIPTEIRACHEEKWTETYDEANRRFSQLLCESK